MINKILHLPSNILILNKRFTLIISRLYFYLLLMLFPCRGRLFISSHFCCFKHISLLNRRCTACFRKVLKT